MSKIIIIHANFETKKYFFSTDHCQGVKGRGKETYPNGFVPTSFHLPMSVVPRPELPSGRIETIKDLILIFCSDEKEIPNPDSSFVPSWVRERDLAKDQLRAEINANTQ